MGKIEGERKQICNFAFVLNLWKWREEKEREERED
jgi:hypothetical protein